MSEREFKNPYQDYDETVSIYDPETEKLVEDVEGPLKENVFILLQTLEKHLASETDWSDTSVYTGTTGIALLYLRFLDSFEDKKDFGKDALSFVEPLLPYLKKKRLSFLCGIAGPLAITSVLYHRKGREKESIDLARRLENLERDVCCTDLPDEVLYGRAGYLYALLFLKKHLAEPDEFRDNAIKAVVKAILASGQRNAKRFKNVQKFPLYFEWHDKPYLGAAHGFTGILCMLLQAKEFVTEEQMSDLVRPTLDIVLSLQFPSGNFPSSVGNPQDKLVHWCHGAPGVIHLMVEAYQVFQDEKYLASARTCSDVIWQRGLLKKGYGLCHGTAGNGYAQLRLFQATKDVKYLYRAVKFGEWCFDYGKHGCRNPDRPFSLFEGFAGTIYYLLDLLKPMQAAFPGLQAS